MPLAEYAGPINHIVVLMFENRSYDNVLGMLYAADNPPPYNAAPADQVNLNGLGSGSYSNVYPLGSGQQTYTVWGTAQDATTIPATDPGEPFEDMAQQILGLTSVPGSSVNPYIGSVGPYGKMGGFVANYAAQNPANLSDVMHYYVPSLMPVTAWLANHFMVCDQWFGSVPTQTFANRLFMHCASSGTVQNSSISYIDDVEYVLLWNQGVLQFSNSLFEQMDSVHGQSGAPNWKIYFHDYSITASLTPYVTKFFTLAGNLNLANYNGEDYPSGYQNPIAYPTTTFLEDIANKTLPPYSFIEPRYTNNCPHAVQGLPPNSNHPGDGNYPLQPLPPDNPPVDIKNGEALLLEIYSALRNSSYWDNTLLIVTYDEHGGIYDHVSPPAATPPGGPPTASGFNFDVLGPRVPAIIVSPCAPAGSMLQPSSGSAPFDHTSILRTAWQCFNLSYGPNGKDAINARDSAAPSILDYLNSAASNNPATEPPGA